MSSFGSKIPKTRRGRLARLHIVAKEAGIDREDLREVAQLMLGYRIESLGDLTDRELGLLWFAALGWYEINVVRNANGQNLADAHELLDRENEDAEETSRFVDKNPW